MPDEDLDRLSGELLSSQHPQPMIAPRSTPDSETERNIWTQQFWRRVYELVRNDKERIVAELTLSEGLMPRQIYALHPKLFRDVPQVNETKRALFERLEQDLILQELHKNRPDAR